ncbi:hypothetical protein M885DRAFT_510619 [Pelagophyceae sp. CCMP2097]|nr:hypothetical protein M885DRAFT_510619 [Pelagophyceae sp. CCMP2097]
MLSQLAAYLFDAPKRDAALDRDDDGAWFTVEACASPCGDETRVAVRETAGAAARLTGGSLAVGDRVFIVATDGSSSKLFSGGWVPNSCLSPEEASFDEEGSLLQPSSSSTSLAYRSERSQRSFTNEQLARLSIEAELHPDLNTLQKRKRVASPEANLEDFRHYDGDGAFYTALDATLPSQKSMDNLSEARLAMEQEVEPDLAALVRRRSIGTPKASLEDKEYDGISSDFVKYSKINNAVGWYLHEQKRVFVVDVDAETRVAKLFDGYKVDFASLERVSKTHAVKPPKRLGPRSQRSIDNEQNAMQDIDAEICPDMAYLLRRNAVGTPPPNLQDTLYYDDPGAWDTETARDAGTWYYARQDEPVCTGHSPMSAQKGTLRRGARAFVVSVCAADTEEAAEDTEEAQGADTAAAETPRPPASALAGRRAKLYDGGWVHFDALQPALPARAP